MAILYPTSLANLVVEVGTRHCHQTLLTHDNMPTGLIPYVHTSVPWWHAYRVNTVYSHTITWWHAYKVNTICSTQLTHNGMSTGLIPYVHKTDAWWHACMATATCSHNWHLMACMPTGLLPYICSLGCQMIVFLRGQYHVFTMRLSTLNYQCWGNR